MKSPVKVWRNQGKDRRILGQKGTVISWSVVRVPPRGYEDQAQYVLCVVRLDNGEVLTAMLVDGLYRLPNIGSTVRTVLRRTVSGDVDGVIPYGVKVQLQEEL